ncbi:MAG: 23S rRNA (pseudouridine(1915)-N(3))-methyltransferase RlmH [Pseudomonadales bacterium]|nr:23S rRNA (pseudouridine(1915)-N(3))-methyltransferase RlmH [Pseudomonadales bacterium]
MKVRILTVSRRQPDWVDAGFNEYARRLATGMPLQLVEIPPVDRRGGASPENVAQYKRQEGDKLLAQLRPRDTVVALDERGAALSTQGLADLLGRWRQEGVAPVFLIGGADGLDAGVTARAQHCYSLAALTMPHGLVRIVLAEALYRAFSLLNNHPYHRP